MSVSSHSDQTDTFLAVRPRLFAVAYRMLGTVSDTEDILQEAFLRWQSAPVSEIRDATGYLVRVTTRLCLDQLKSARARRETYPGEWLPEPLLTEDSTERLDHDVSVALLLALERLTPLERAAFLLHDVFDSSYEEVAAALGRSAGTCRQLAARARKNVQQARPRAPVPAEEGQEITLAFFHAAKTGDTGSLARLLSKDVRLISDGGGKVMAALNPIKGLDRVVRLLEGISRKTGAEPPRQWRHCVLNGLPAILSREPDGILQATSVEIRDGLITHIYVTRNPDKTAHLVQALPLPE
ncbi:sigma-70 family RNA polymerase sigma factor [Ruegeria sp. HKCCD8929]|uniref:sigma-70 family RNA polymerase sigma factor n=1 Tax=Ruegeria sp. HKCCD8929 TaxID=2683006 RepID=UPI0014879C40